MPENVKVARNNGRWLGRLEKFHSMRNKTRKYLRKKKRLDRMPEIPNERKPLRIREKKKTKLENANGCWQKAV